MVTQPKENIESEPPKGSHFLVYNSRNMYYRGVYIYLHNTKSLGRPQSYPHTNMVHECKCKMESDTHTHTHRIIHGLF